MSMPFTVCVPSLAWAESREAQRRLLRAAREAVSESLGKPLSVSDAANSVVSPVGSCHGLFVTLTVSGKLRGCIGTFDPTDRVEESVRDVARSALRDPRFQHCPLTVEELPLLTTELSLLSPLQRVAEPLTLKPGVHGIIIRQGNRSGCFLPRVPADRGWTIEEALSQCCVMKAGLPADAWKKGETEVWAFTAVVFSEPIGDGSAP